MEKSWMLVDEKVIQDAINKEENAINLIYEQTINSAYFVAQTHACNISYINDILQDSYIRVFEHLDTLHDYTKLQSWINAIVRNKALDYNRKCKEWTFSDLISDGDEEWDTEDENGKFIPEKEVDYVETRKIMMQIISALPSDQRICVYMRYYDQLSVNEIAQELQCNSETVKSRIRYAKKKLKESVLELEKQGTKLYAIPGVRLGYILAGSEKVIERVNRAGQAWSVSHIAQCAGVAALADNIYKEKVIDTVAEELAYMKKEFYKLPVVLYDGAANYLFFRTPKITDLDKQLEGHGIMIRNCSNYVNLGRDYWRVAVKAHEENKKLIKALRMILKGEE